MREIKVQSADREVCSPYGIFTRLTDYECFTGEGWECWMTEELCMNQPAKFEVCHRSQEQACIVEKLGKSENSQRLLVCGNGTLLVAVAAKSVRTPDINEVKVFLLEKGEIFVLHPGVWHFETGLKGAVDYYVLTTEAEFPQNEWPISGGPFTVAQ